MSALDAPWKDVLRAAEQQIASGAIVLQKFTCSGCGGRLTMQAPNTFYDTGSCDRCPTITNIEAQGCGFTLIHVLRSDDDAIRKALRASLDYEGEIPKQLVIARARERSDA